MNTNQALENYLDRFHTGGEGYCNYEPELIHAYENLPDDIKEKIKQEIHNVKRLSILSVDLPEDLKEAIAPLIDAGLLDVQQSLNGFRANASKEYYPITLPFYDHNNLGKFHGLTHVNNLPKTESLTYQFGRFSTLSLSNLSDLRRIKAELCGFSHLIISSIEAFIILHAPEQTKGELDLDNNPVATSLIFNDSHTTVDVAYPHINNLTLVNSTVEIVSKMPVVIDEITLVNSTITLRCDASVFAKHINKDDVSNANLSSISEGVIKPDKVKKLQSNPIAYSHGSFGRIIDGLLDN